MRPKSTTDARFWAKVNKTATCWEWTACRDKDGYGFFSYQKKLQHAHRVSWQMHYGPIPDGMQVNHHCDNPSCVRPEHLFLGTQAANIADKVAKGRQASGDRSGSRLHPERRVRGEAHWLHQHPERMHGSLNPAAKLTEDDVREMRRLAAAGVKNSMLAQQFGIERSRVWQIVTRRVWKHVA